MLRWAVPRCADVLRPRIRSPLVTELWLGPPHTSPTLLTRMPNSPLSLGGDFWFTGLNSSKLVKADTQLDLHTLLGNRAVIISQPDRRPVKEELSSGWIWGAGFHLLWVSPVPCFLGVAIFVLQTSFRLFCFFLPHSGWCIDSSLQFRHLSLWNVSVAVAKLIS